MSASVRGHARWLIAVLAVMIVLSTTLVALGAGRTPRKPRTPRLPRSWTQIDPTSWQSMVKPYVAPKPVVVHHAAPAPSRAASEGTGSIWDCIAKYESGGNWSSTSGMFEGGLQFLPSTWRAAGGTRYAAHAYQATKAQQIEIASSWLSKTSWAQWPNTSRMCGVR